jgi:hypothetical protein
MTRQEERDGYCSGVRKDSRRILIGTRSKWGSKTTIGAGAPLKGKAARALGCWPILPMPVAEMRIVGADGIIPANTSHDETGIP